MKKRFLYHLYLIKEIRKTMMLTQNLKVLYKLLSICKRDTLDCEIARMFYFSGLPFNLARSPYYKSAFSYVVNTYNLSGYVTPTYNKLRGPLLSKEISHVESLLQPIRNSWNQKGVTIVSDGWSHPQRRPLINFMAIIESGPMFLKSIYGSGEIKHKDFITKHMRCNYGAWIVQCGINYN